MRTATPTNFSNGYIQDRPFSICIVGPSQRLCSVFFHAFRSKLEESTAIDFIVDQHPDLPRPQNYVRVARPARSVGEGRVLYTLTWESLLLEEISFNAGRGHIDAYILAFETNAPEQFASINVRDMNRVLQMCREDSWGPKKAIVLAGHHADPFSAETGYTVDELRALMRRSHAVFRRGNFTSPTQCAEVVDLLVTFLTSIHASHQLSKPHESELVPRSSTSSLLGSLYEMGLSWQSHVFPLCLPASLRATFGGGDPDRPREWTDEERALHTPPTMKNATPMGVFAER